MSTRRRAKQRRKPSRVFLFDVDNTLLDNDRVVKDLRSFLTREVGSARCGRYWKIFEQLRSQCGFADYLGALQRYRELFRHEMRLLAVSRYLIDYPFSRRLFAKSFEVLQHVRRWGQVALLTDGDVVFQPHKIERAGLYQAVKGHVLIYVHKQNELADVEARYPADHYVVVDDKLHILTAIKKVWGERVTTVFARQGHYARDRQILSANPAADLTIQHIGQLLQYNLEGLLHPKEQAPVRRAH